MWNHRLIAALALAASGSTVACGSSSEDPGTGNTGEPAAGECSTPGEFDAYSAGMAKTGDEGIDVAITSATPAPPVQGDNEWTLMVTDADGAPVTGATLEIVPWMVVHKHGTPVTPRITEGSDGEYTATRVNFVMAGVWETTIRVTTADGVTDEVMFPFCIE